MQCVISFYLSDGRQIIRRRTSARVPLKGLNSGKARGSLSCSERHGGLLVRVLAQFLNISGFDQPVSTNTKTIIMNFSLQ